MFHRRNDRTRKFVLTATALILGVIGFAWSIVPATFVGIRQIAPSTGATYLGNRMGTMLFAALGVTAWLSGNTANIEGKRALKLGALVGMALMTDQSLYGAVVLVYATWGTVIGEALLTLCFIWVLFIRPEPVV